MESFNPLVSCIIPVYNAEKYLDQGINSLLAQTYDNVEIILVDDQSTDGSWEVCKRYAASYANILAFQNSQNAGAPLRGRERGIQEARGEWITFMDCDDYVTPTYVEHLIKATQGGEYDIAITGHSRLHPDGRLEDFLWDDYSQTTNQRLATFYRHFLTNDFWTDPTDTVGQNLVRASICKGTDLSRYPNLVWAEDTLMALAFLANSENGVNFVDKHDFIWRQVEGSGSHGGFSDRADRSAFYKACYEIFHDSSIYEAISQISPLVSVIIPVYNVEQYLPSCLESVVSQTYKNLEIIIVNDGTEDRSQTIINKFQKLDSRIIALKQKNQGLNMARAAGAKVSTGEYITFVDSDDVIQCDYTKSLYESLLKNNVDISAVGFANFSEDLELNKLKEPDAKYPDQVLRGKNEVLECFLGQIPIVPNVHPMTAWGKLYKSHIIKATDWDFSNYRRNEDNFELLQWYNATTEGVVISSEPLYFYRKNPNSITRKLQPNVNPDGKTINYFEYLDELYEKTKLYLNDDSLSVSILNYFSNINSVQLHNFASNGQLDKESAESAARNMGKITNIFNQYIYQKDELIRRQDGIVSDIYSSTSWRATKSGRRLKRLYSKIKSRLS